MSARREIKNGRSSVADGAQRGGLDGHCPEHQVGLAEDLRAHRAPLGIVTVQQRGIRLAPDDEREFPREIICVLDTGVHPLPAGRAVDVRGIPGEEDAVHADSASLCDDADGMR